MALDGIELRDGFREVVTSEAELRAIGRRPASRSLDKVVRVIDEHSRRFIASRALRLHRLGRRRRHRRCLAEG